MDDLTRSRLVRLARIELKQDAYDSGARMYNMRDPKDRRARRQVDYMDRVYNSERPTERMRAMESAITNAGYGGSGKPERTQTGAGRVANPVNDLMDERIMPNLRPLRVRRRR